MKIIFLIGTRPEAIKMHPLIQEMRNSKQIKVVVVKSGQHKEMVGIDSDYDLNVMKENQSINDILSRILIRFEKILFKEKPEMVLVHGDTSTTLAGSLCAFHLGIPVGHVEAGLRTYSKNPFPEEMNRRIVDLISSIHFCPTQSNRNNILNEMKKKNVFVTGNTGIDALLNSKIKPIKNKFVKNILEKGKKIVLFTCHRRESFGEPFERICKSLVILSSKFTDIEWIYPVHPNPYIRDAAKKILGQINNVHLVEPLDYSDLLKVINLSSVVMTDSGGLQEEACSFKKRVIVMREITERKEGIKAGYLTLAGTKTNSIVRKTIDALMSKKIIKGNNPFGDGKASQKIVGHLLNYACSI